MRDFLAAVRARPPFPPRREALPLALLLLALASAFAFGGDRSQFYRPSVHDDISTQTLTLAANLSAEHGFAGFLRRELDEDGEPRYRVYHRFPIGSYALVGLAILPFGDDFPRAIRAARLLMLACFAAAAVLAYLALARLLGDRRIALAATLLAFSPYYLLYHNDMVSAEGSTNLFGVMLVFHGMAVFAQEGRFRQLLVRTAAAVLLGWHVLALAAPFAAIGLAGELLRARAGGGSGARAALAALVRSRYLAYGAFAALCCALALGWNFASEYRALGGETALTDLPSFRSMLRRGGLDAAQEHVGGLGWAAFLRGQLGGVGGMALPFAAADRLGLGLAQPYYDLWPPPPVAARLAALGAAVAAACLAGLRRLPQRTVFAALLLAGWCWAIPARGSTAFHQFEAMFHVGYPLVLWALALLGLRRALGRGRARLALPAIAAAAIAVFALSAALAARTGHDAEAAALQREAAADLRAARAVLADRSVFYGVRFPGTPTVTRLHHYYLTGSVRQTESFVPGADRERILAYEFILLGADFGGSLTPRNRRIHLYRTAGLPDIIAAAAAREPAARSRFDLHLEGRTLTWLRAPCGDGDTETPFFVHAVPADAGDLPAERRAAGYEALGFRFPERGVRLGGWCMAAIELPDYPLAGVRAGQRREGRPAAWEAEIAIDADAWRDRYGAATAGEPALRAAFDVRLDGRTLTYARDGCSAADAAPRFFLHAVPADAGDLPADRRAAGFANLDFAFAERGVRFGGRCLASAELPDYPVARVRTGQFAGGERLWEGEFALPAAAP